MLTDLPFLVLSSSFLISSCFCLSSRISLRISSLRVFLSIFIWFDTSVFITFIKLLTNPSVPSTSPAVKLTINKQIKQTLINSMLVIIDKYHNYSTLINSGVLVKLSCILSALCFTVKCKRSGISSSP